MRGVGRVARCVEREGIGKKAIQGVKYSQINNERLSDG
jgi:hypothetical protein